MHTRDCCDDSPAQSGVHQKATHSGKSVPTDGRRSFGHLGVRPQMHCEQGPPSWNRAHHQALCVPEGTRDAPVVNCVTGHRGARRGQKSSADLRKVAHSLSS